MNIAILLKLVRAVPKYGRVVYCLYRDARTPRGWKIGLALTVGAIVTPFINIPEVVPVLGEMETVGLLLLAVRIFVARAPHHLVAEHEAAIEAGTSIYDQDLRRARASAEDMRDRLAG